MVETVPLSDIVGSSASVAPSGGKESKKLVTGV